MNRAASIAKSAIDVWNQHFLRNEGALSVFLAGTIVLWSEFFGGINPISEILKGNRGTIYGALTSVFGSLLGFAITAESIVLGLSGSERLTNVRDSEHWSTLWDTFVAAIRCLGLATAASLIGLIFDRDSTPLPWVFYFVLFSSFLAVARLARCVWILEQVVAIVSAKSQERRAGE